MGPTELEAGNTDVPRDVRDTFGLPGTWDIREQELAKGCVFGPDELA